MVAGEGLEPPIRAPDAKTIIDCCVYLKWSEIRDSNPYELTYAPKAYASTNSANLRHTPPPIQ